MTDEETQQEEEGSGFDPEESMRALESSLDDEEWLEKASEGAEFDDERDPGRVVNGLKSNEDKIQFSTGDESLTASSRVKNALSSYSQKAVNREGILQRLKGRIEEKNSRDVQPIAEDLLGIKGEARTVSEDLRYEKDLERDDYSDEGLLSFVEEHSREAEEYGEEIQNLLGRISDIKDEKDELKDKKEKAINTTRDEPSVVQEEDAEAIDVDVNELFADVEEAQNELYSEEIQGLNRQQTSLEEEHLEPAKKSQSEVLEELDEVYNDYASDVETFVVTATDAVSQKFETLENLASADLPETSETYPNKLANDAEQELEELLAETAAEVGNWISEVYSGAAAAYDELQTVEGALPEYREDEDRLEKLAEELDLSQDYDSVSERLTTLVDEASHDYGVSNAIDEFNTLLEDIERSYE